MIRLLWTFSVHIRSILRYAMPTNLLLDLIRTRRGLKWGIPAMLLSVPYLLAARICVNLVSEGWPGWVNLLVLLFAWNAMKFLSMGPVSVILLIWARIRDARRPPVATQAASRAERPSQLPRRDARHLHTDVGSG